MSALSFKPQSVTQLAQHIVPAFSSCCVLIESLNDNMDGPLLNGDMRELTLQLPNESVVESVPARVVLRFEPTELANWCVMAISNDAQPIVHRIRYLCRHQRSEYGKLFHQLMDDFITN